MEQNPPRRNLEIKATCPDPEAARKAARRLAGPPAATLHQVDTYFSIPTGRLKLREIDTTSAELIYYDRPDDPAVRISRYHIAPVTDPAALKRLLSAALGIRAVVRKRRELFLYENVRIHLDTVEKLGNFIELEAVLSGHVGQAESQPRLELVARALDIRPEQRLAGSYGELVLVDRPNGSNETETPPST
jgi:predicted adenylyl cyclase CyaB